MSTSYFYYDSQGKPCPVPPECVTLHSDGCYYDDHGHNCHPQLDGIVSGTSGADLIDINYTGDPQGDRIDHNDAILGNAGSNDDIVYAYGGNDTVKAGDANDTVYGGDGKDLIYGGVGKDVLYGDADNDTLYGGDGNDALYGGTGNDVLNGEAGNDTLRGDAGDDGITGGAGADLLEGGDGNDVIDGGDDADVLYGGAGNDKVYGGGGADSAFGGSGNDAIDGGDGADTIFGDAGSDQITAGAGNDLVYGGGDNDKVESGDGNDTLGGDAGNDDLRAGNGDDALYGGAGEDQLRGEAGNDTLSGGDDHDDLFGGDDRDLFIEVGAKDMIDGGEGGDDFDTLDLTGAGPLSVSYNPGNPESGKVTFYDADHNVTGTLTFKNIENVVPCFTPGTLIATPRGEVPVEELRAGDRVITRDNGLQEIRWVGRRDLEWAELVSNPHLKPIQIRAGALGNGLPERDMLVSPNHRMLVANDRTQLYFDEHEVLVAAKHLISAEGVRAIDVARTAYLHFLCDRHEVVLSNGAWTETFQPGDYTLKGMGNAQRSEIFELFPDLKTEAGVGNYTAARRTLKRHEALLALR